MRGKEAMARRAASNLAAVQMDLAAARADGDAQRVLLLETLIASGGAILLYRPHLQHIALLFGDIDPAEHVAVIVPGVGDGTNLSDDWIPDAQNLFEKAPDTAVVLWKGYDNPVDIMAAAVGSIECSDELVTAAGDLTAFVESLELEPDQSLTIVAHSFGSIVTGAALADCGLIVTDVIVAGSPGMTVDDLRELHVEQSHFFAEQAPGDAVAELGVFGASPSSPTFGGTRMSVNAPDHPHVQSHSGYFTPGSEALENIADVVTGHYEDVERHRPTFPEIAGGLVSWALRVPVLPLQVVGRRYRGPGYRVMTDWCRLVDLGATETGNLVTEVLDEGERALFWLAHRIGALPDLEFGFEFDPEPQGRGHPVAREREDADPGRGRPPGGGLDDGLADAAGFEGLDDVYDAGADRGPEDSA